MIWLFDKIKKPFYLVEKDVIKDSREAIITFLETTNYALWNKVVARNKIKYTEQEQCFYEKSGKTTNFGDDLYLLMLVLCECEKIYFTSECLYNYLIAEQSISHLKIIDSWEELLIRSRLMEFTYYAISSRQLMDKKIRNLIKVDTAVILMPSIIHAAKQKKLKNLKIIDFLEKLL